MVENLQAHEIRNFYFSRCGILLMAGCICSYYFLFYLFGVEVSGVMLLLPAFAVALMAAGFFDLSLRLGGLFVFGELCGVGIRFIPLTFFVPALMLMVSAGFGIYALLQPIGQRWEKHIQRFPGRMKIWIVAGFVCGGFWSIVVIPALAVRLVIGTNVHFSASICWLLGATVPVLAVIWYFYLRWVNSFAEAVADDLAWAGKNPQGCLYSALTGNGADQLLMGIAAAERGKMQSAYRWYRKSFSGDHNPEAMAGILALGREGILPERLMLRWSKIAAKHQMPIGFLEMAEYHGKKSGEDSREAQYFFSKAISCFAQAAENGDAFSFRMLLSLLKRLKKYDDLAKTTEKYLGHENREIAENARLILAECYRRGHGVPRDPDKAQSLVGSR